MMSVLTSEGHATLLNKKLRLTRSQLKETQTLETKSELQQVFADVFGLRLPQYTIDSLWEKLGSRGLV